MIVDVEIAPKYNQEYFNTEQHDKSDDKSKENE